MKGFIISITCALIAGFLLGLNYIIRSCERESNFFFILERKYTCEVNNEK